jgi:hypothetical protein
MDKVCASRKLVGNLQEYWIVGRLPDFDAISPARAIMDEIILTREPEAEAQRIEDNLKAAAAIEIHFRYREWWTL